MREDGLELKKSAASTQQQISFNVSYYIHFNLVLCEMSFNNLYNLIKNTKK